VDVVSFSEMAERMVLKLTRANITANKTTINRRWRMDMGGISLLHFSKTVRKLILIRQVVVDR